MRINSLWRWLVVPIALLVVGTINFNVAGDSGQVVISTYGGTFLQSQRKAYFEPFEHETGIHVVVTGEPTPAKIKAMVDSGNVEWDLAEHSLEEMSVMQRQNLLARIDYSGFPPEERAEILPDVVKPYGIGTLFFASGVAFNTKAFQGGNNPKSWADVWDVQHFPGPRTLTAMDFDPAPLEIPLLADGVSPKNLYPLDIDRAFRALDRIRSSVSKWAGTNIDATVLLASGEAVVGSASTGRILSMRDQGAPVNIEWNQALLYGDVWVIPRGAKNYKNALRFLQFASSAKNQALFAAIYPVAPVNRGAYRYLSAAQAARLPTSPQNVSKVIVVNADWWAQMDASGKSNAEKVAERWRQWILQK
jgi:putative spermidine/putrescine transport system substrate-binding protein